MNSATDQRATGIAFERSLRFGRAALVLLAFACLTTGVWGGLVRLYWTYVPPTNFSVHWVTFHGPLMVCGFLGTLIGVERATALGRWWGYSGPFLTAAGGLTLAGGILGTPGPLMIAAGSLCVLVATSALFWRQPSLDLGILIGGTGLWLVGNLLWYWAWYVPETIHRTIFWWIGFLLLTVFAERLELSRFLAVSRVARALAALAVGVYVVGLLIRPWWPLCGERTMGTAMLVMAAWLFRNDVARRTVRRPGLPRFVAICLLTGYTWLAIVGIGLWTHEPLPAYGVLYDSILHAFFLGFVFSMIFAHAPIVFEAVLGIAIPFNRFFYAHLVLLQVSLLVRILGDILSVSGMAAWPKMHGWGGMINALAIALFFVTTLLSAALKRRSQPAPSLRAPRPWGVSS